MLGFEARGLQPRQGLADAVLKVQERRLIQSLCKLRQQVRLKPRHQIEHSGGGFDRQIMGTGGKHQERHEQADRASDGNLEQAFESRCDRARLSDGGCEKYQHHCEWCGTEARI